MNKKLLIGGILGLIVVIAIVAFIFLGKSKDNKNIEDTNQSIMNNMTNDEMAKELSKISGQKEEDIKAELDVAIDEQTQEDLQQLINMYVIPEDAVPMEDDNPDDAKYSMIDKDGNIYDIVDPFLLMTDEEAEEYIRRMDEANKAELNGADEEEVGRLELSAEDLLPEIPPENYIDQNILDDGFEADIDPETGDVGYWNPNTEDDPLTDALATTERPAGYDPNFDPSQGDSVVIRPDDPWANQPELDFVGDGG